MSGPGTSTRTQVLYENTLTSTMQIEFQDSVDTVHRSYLYYVQKLLV